MAKPKWIYITTLKGIEELVEYIDDKAKGIKIRIPGTKKVRLHNGPFRHAHIGRDNRIQN